MARVQMLHHIAGGRGDGTEWPHAGDVLVCSEQEARDLVAGSNACWLPGGDTVTPPPGAATLAAETSAAPPAGGESPETGDGSESGDGKPRVRDPKDAWEMHAISLGATPELVAAMTKADLIAQFGNPA